MKEDLPDLGYRTVGQIGKGCIGVVYKAYEPGSNRVVGVKLIHRGEGGFPPGGIERLMRDLNTLSGRDLPGLAAVYRIGEFEGGIYIVSEYVEGVDLGSYRSGGRLRVKEAVGWVMKICEGLSSLHGCGMVHGNLKPGNILLIPGESSQGVRLFHPGLLNLVDLGNPQVVSCMGASLAYISPEQTGLLGRPVDQRSDLYSLGVIFFELLTGKAPLGGTGAGTMLARHVAVAPCPLRTIEPEIPEGVERVVLRLLRKDPAERYQDVASLLPELEDLYAERDGTAPRPETSAVSADESGEPVRFRTRLIGREEELRMLRGRFARCSRGRGSIVLIRGPAGIGKTRLVETFLGSHEQARPMILRGKCGEFSERSPYGPIREALQALCNSLPGLPEEQRDRVLKSLEDMEPGHLDALIRFIPRFADLTERAGTGALLDSERATEGFFEAFLTFLRGLSGHGKPVILFLDDLQWADQGTSHLLGQIAPGLPETSVMVLCAFRDAPREKKFPLASFLAKAEGSSENNLFLKVGPLEPVEVQILLTEMLGGAASVEETLLKEVLLRGEGNPLFVCEMVKSMVEAKALSHAGGLWSLSPAWLGRLGPSPDIIDIILSRTKTLSREDLQVLSLASMIGLTFDSDTILELIDLSELAVKQALTRAARRQLIRVASVKPVLGYQFFHDQIREALYQKTPKEDRAALHLRIARLVESRDDAQGERVYELEYHFSEAEDAGNAYLYAVKAGQRARQEFAYREAARYFEKARSLQNKVTLPDSAGERVHIAESLGDLYSMIGDYEESLRCFKDCLGLGGLDRLRETSLERRIGRTYFRKGAHPESLAHLTKALDRMGRRVPPRLLIRTEILFRILDHLVRRALRLSPARISQRLTKRKPFLLELATVYRDLYFVYFFTDFEYAVTFFLRYFSLAERLKDPSLLGDAYWLMCMFYVAGTPWPSTGFRYMEASRSLRQTLGDRWGLAQCRSWKGVSLLYRGEVGPAYPLCEEGVRLFERIGDRWEFENVSVHLSMIHILRGDFSSAIECTEKLKETALETGNFRGMILADVIMGMAHLCRGETSRSLACIQNAVRLSETTEQPFFGGISYGAQGIYYLHGGEVDLAIDHLGRGASRILESRLQYSYYMQQLFISLAIAYLIRAERNSDSSGALMRADLKKARRMIRFAKRTASRFPLATAVLDIFTGWEKWLRGNREAAAHLFSKGMQRLDRSGASFLESLACLCIGRLISQRDEQEGNTYLARASQILPQFEAGSAFSHARILPGESQGPFPNAQKERQTAYGAPHPEVLAGGASILPRRGLDLIALVSRILADTMGPEAKLSAVLDACIETLGAERGCVVVFRPPEYKDKEEGEDNAPEMKRLLFRLARAFDKRDLDWSDFSYCLAAVREAARSGEPILIGDASSDERAAIREEAVHRGLRSILCTVIKTGERILGGLYLENRLLSHLFTLEHGKVLGIVSEQTAMRIENEAALRRVSEQQREIEELTRRARDEDVSLAQEEVGAKEWAEIVGTGQGILSVMTWIEKAAPLDSTVLIRGESGTGKELVARAVHNLSPRRNGALVVVNSAALPEGLLESELFGHEKGAFTGAIRRRLGRFEQAHGGTLFLDEIGDLSPRLQAKLLRVLQEGKFERVGGMETHRTDARILAATNRNLEEAIEKGRFREDLFYRLNVVTIHVPPLRERKEDIPLLVGYFLNKLNRKLDRSFKGIEKGSMQEMLRYRWPGNVRELQNVLERAMILSQGDLVRVQELEPAGLPEPFEISGLKRPYHDAVEGYKRQLIKQTISTCGGNKSAAAQRLGIDPTYLSRLIKQLRVE